MFNELFYCHVFYPDGDVFISHHVTLDCIICVTISRAIFYSNKEVYVLTLYNLMAYSKDNMDLVC